MQQDRCVSFDLDYEEPSLSRACRAEWLEEVESNESNALAIQDPRAGESCAGAADGWF